MKSFSYIMILTVFLAVSCSYNQLERRNQADVQEEFQQKSDDNPILTYHDSDKVVLKSLSNLNCPEGIITMEIGSVSNASILSEEISFKIGGIDTLCKGLPEIIPVLTKGDCNISVGGGIQRIEVYGPASMALSSGFSCYSESRFPRASFTINPQPAAESYHNVSEFIDWTVSRNINLVATNKSSNDIYYNGFDSEKDSIAIENVDDWWIVETALKKIPNGILKAGKDKTIYLSTRKGRSYTFVKTEETVLRAPPGVIYEQHFSEETVVHEFGHIVDLAGINSKGKSEHPYDIYSDLKPERDRIFQVDVLYNPNATEASDGYISVYSTANDQENFAEHFAYFLLFNEDFKDKAENDILLKEKYDFFDKLFKRE